MTPLTTFYLTIALAISAKTLAWVIQLRTRNAGVVDTVWALTLGAMALLYSAVGDAPIGLRLLLAAIALSWSLRLGLHLHWRNHGRPEDWRYARFRARWGDKANRNMFGMFQFQNLFSLALASFSFAPVVWRDELPSAPAIGLAIVIALIAIVGEAMADAQMEAHRRDPARAGSVCDRGLWRYSRHPNYFFECLHWLAYVPLAAGGVMLWPLSLLSPLIMALLLMKLSGVPLLEAEMLRRKPGYADYLRRTSALLPWPPRR